MCLARVHATTFGGSPKFVFRDDAKQKLAETTVKEFGEYNTVYIALYVFYVT